MIKLTNYKTAIDELENVDLDIAKALDEASYTDIIDLLKARMIIISQINQMRASSEMPSAELERVKKIMANADQIQGKIAEKKEQIGQRLSKHRKVVTQNKNFGYRRTGK